MVSVFSSNYSSFANIHRDSIVAYCNQPNRKKLKLSKLDDCVRKHFGILIQNFSELLLATPSLLFELKIVYDAKSTRVKGKINKELGMIGMYSKFIDKNCEFRYNNKQYNSNFISNKIDIRTCPYCNENSTYSFYFKNVKNYRRTFDWDHIIPKEKYPFLAISYYNIVPSCKVCNQLKGEDIIYVNPHSKFNPDLTYTFMVKGQNINFITDPNNIMLLMRVKKNAGGIAIKNVIDKVGLDARLPTQISLVQDILNKKIIYKSVYWARLEQFVSKQSKKKINLLDLFFSVQFNNDEYYKRPFSKLTRDLIK